MGFLNPLLLFGLAAVSVPIIIHLLNRRKFQKVVWAAMRFIKTSVEQNQRRMRVEDLILLALRCLLLALLALREAGLTSLPGGGAEVFSTAVRATIAERKLTGEEWIRVHRTAHELGIPTNCTMLYGHVETAADRIEHLAMLRGLQDETGGFLTYIPLAYHPDHNELGEEMGRVGTATTGYEDLKNIAIGRLFLDNVPHIKTHWPMVTPFLSQIALSFGCDDVEGTVVYERVYHEAGAHTQMHMPYLELVRLIRGAGKRPVERDSLYQPVREEFDDPPPEPTLRRGATLPVVHAA